MKTVINGITYEPIPQPEFKKSSKTLSKIMMLASMLEISSPYAPKLPKSKPLPTNDIVKEFELIELKKSNLSRSERYRVVRAFYQSYRKV